MAAADVPAHTRSQRAGPCRETASLASSEEDILFSTGTRLNCRSSWPPRRRPTPSGGNCRRRRTWRSPPDKSSSCSRPSRSRGSRRYRCRPNREECTFRSSIGTRSRRSFLSRYRASVTLRVHSSVTTTQRSSGAFLNLNTSWDCNKWPAILTRNWIFFFLRNYLAKRMVIYNNLKFQPPHFTILLHCSHDFSLHFHWKYFRPWNANIRLRFDIHQLTFDCFQLCGCDL